MKILETNRLILREFENKDAEFLFQLNANPNVLKYTGDEPFASINEAEIFIKDYDHYQKFGMGRWTVIEKATNIPIGWCGLKNHNNEFIDLGFRFLEDYWNKGFATESAKACIDFGFNQLNLDKIVGRTMRKNFGSKRVLEKIGMQFSHKKNVDGLHEALIFKISR